ncbi:MAG TPA: YcxB family protein [Bryobacteraceae bacterium]|nr:YcxB family protein [Bryobacteraceae bacterium]
MIQLRGTLTLADLARFQYFHVLRRTWPGLILVLLIGLAILALIVAVPNPNILKNAAPLLTLFVIWLALLAVTPYWNARRQFARQRYLREPVSQTFSTDGIKSIGPSVSTELQWSVMQTVRETKSQFLLYYAPNQALLVPKRFFTDDAQLASWRDVARAGMSPKDIKQSAIGRWF